MGVFDRPPRTRTRIPVEWFALAPDRRPMAYWSEIARSARRSGVRCTDAKSIGQLMLAEDIKRGFAPRTT